MIAIDDFTSEEPGMTDMRSDTTHAAKKSAREKIRATRDTLKKKTRPPLTETHTDPWAGWGPLWTNSRKTAKSQPKTPPAEKAAEKTVHDRQEQHSPTEHTAASSSKRRITDSRLWDAMTEVQQDAALHIAAAFETMSRGLGYAGSDWTRVRSGSRQGNIGAAHGKLIDGYVEWVQRCQKERIGHAMIMDILVFGHSCRSVDQDRRQRSGRARENLMAGLELYCRLQGWR